MAGKIPLKQDIIYGPVNSRRLGKSLGVNLTPPGRKICSFDCIYCQYGETELRCRTYDPNQAPTPEEVTGKLRRFLEESEQKPSFITFSGNGEPTLHPEFNKIVEEVKELKSQYSDPPLVLLSNASKVDTLEYVSAINKVDLPIMKLDVGSAGKFESINKPSQITFTELVEGLKKIENLHIQSIKFEGEVENTGADLREWIEVIEEIQPEFVQVYNLDRPASLDLQKTSDDKLLGIKEILASKGIRSEVY